MSIKVPENVPYIPNATVYVVATNALGLYVAQASGTPEAYTQADWGNYAITASEVGGANTTGFYTASFGSNWPAGSYNFQWFAQQGGSPHYPGSSGDPMFWETGPVAYDGTSVAITQTPQQEVNNLNAIAPTNGAAVTNSLFNVAAGIPLSVLLSNLATAALGWTISSVTNPVLVIPSSGDYAINQNGGTGSGGMPIIATYTVTGQSIPNATNMFAYLGPGGVGVPNVPVQMIPQSVYDAGNSTAISGSTVTTDVGGWTNFIFVNSGTYYLFFGQILGQQAVQITVVVP